MTPTTAETITPSVRDFLRDDEDDFVGEPQPRTIRQPENSPERQRQAAESASVGAVRRNESSNHGAESHIEIGQKGADFNPVLNGDDEEYDGENAAQPLRTTPVLTPKPTEEGTEQPGPATKTDSFGRKRKMNPSAPKYGRTQMREKDFLVMAFLRKFGFATSKQLGIILGVKGPTAHKRALGLKEVGLLGSDKIFGATQLWYLTGRGYEVLDFHHIYDERISKRYHPGKGVPTKLEHTLAVIHVAAQLVGGVSELRFIPGVELAPGLDLLPALVPEPYMNSEYSRATAAKKGKSDTADSPKTKPSRIAFEKQRTVAQWIRDKKITKSEALHQHPFLWTVVNHSAASESNEVKESHPADLVLDLSVLGQDWSGIKRIAIEVELSAKQAPELRKIIRSFYMNYTSTDVNVFDYVAYISHKESIKEAVEAAAAKVIDRANPSAYVGTYELKDADGEIFNGKAWTL
jgi:hypothetical protein